MKCKKLFTALLAVCLALSVAGCSSDSTGVYVQSVAELVSQGGIAPGDRFAGILVSENVTEVRKDQDKTVSELLVKEGDDVTEGQPLFSYDTDQLELSLNRQRLELEQLKASIQSYKEQIEELKKERANAPAGDRLEYTIQIQTLEIDLKEAELSVAAEENAVLQAEALLENATVYSPVTGRVQSVNEGGYDNYGNPLPYIAIRQAGAYRVKGTIGELQLGGIFEGTRMRILSRTDETKFWTGTVSLIDFENPYQGSEYDMYYGTGSDEMTSASKYPFYVELDDPEGLILGQHVYLELDTGDAGEQTGLQLSSVFLCYSEDGSVYVWAEGQKGLEKRVVELGEYNMGMDTYEILSGLTEDDYIAFPDDELCVEGAPTTRELSVAEETPMEGGVG